MFSKKAHLDVKKSSQRVLDVKKDSFNRLKHLRTLLDNFDVNESKHFFECYYSHIYYIFFDMFTNLEAPLKQRGQKQAREELDSTLFIFEKILILLPELIAKRWQHNSIILILKKMLHHGNSIKMRQEGMRLFLIWYQILENVNDQEVEQMFMSLVPGIVPHIPNPFLVKNDQTVHSKEAFFYADYSLNATNEETVSPDTSVISSSSLVIAPCEIEPLVPVFSIEPQPQDVTCYYLQCLMDYIVSQVTKIQWKEQKEYKHLKSFEFLFKKLRLIYFPYIFPNLNDKFSFYSPTFEPPKRIHYEEEDLNFDPKRLPNRDTLQHCKAVVIRWLAKYLRNEEVEAVPRRESIDDLHQQQQSFRLPLSVSSFTQQANEQQITTEWREPSPIEYDIVRSTLNSNVENVNLIHEIFRQAFLMPFSHAMTMRKVVAVYKDWIYKNVNEVPLLLKEPHNLKESDSPSITGISCLLRVFITNASNVFLSYVPPEKPLLLEEQVDMCKRVLNIYRYMVMKMEMDKNTWEQLLVVMLRITSLVLTKDVPTRKEDTLGGRLAPAFFQTLIVTWIKANLNVYISSSLWEQFQLILSSLTSWEELIKEWCKTMDTVTRVMSRYVYGINLHDLPLERPSERRQKKIRGFRKLADGDIRRGDVKVNQPATDDVNYPNSSANKGQLNRMRSSSGNSPPNRSPKFSAISDQPFTPGVLRSASDSHLLAKRNIFFQPTKGKVHPEVTDSSSKSSERSKSLENIYQRIDSPSFSESSISQSRSPSPTPSSGLESNSLKDSPLHLDGCSASSSEVGMAGRSIIAGGSHRGWTPDSAVILWRRMLGVIGDLNSLKEPMLHQHVMECIGKMIDDFSKIRDNLGVPLDNQSTPSPPVLIPPIYFFAPYLLRTVQLSNDYKLGKLIAYKYICLMLTRRHEISLLPDFLTCFYRTLHQAFISYDMEIICTIMKYCSGKLFSLGLPGSSCLLFDFISGANMVLSSPQTKAVPRTEALGFLGTLIGMSALYKDIHSLQPNSSEPSLTQCKDLKDHLLSMLLKASKREQTGLGRSVALNSLGIFMYLELQNRSNHSRLVEVTEVLISATRFNNRVLSRIACDLLRLQCDHVTYLLDNRPEIPKRIIEGLLSSLIMHWQYAHKHDCMKELKNLLLSLTLCLGEWCLSVPKVFLITTTTAKDSDESLLRTVLNGLTCIIKGEKMFSNANTSLETDEIDMEYNITVDNLHGFGVTPNTSPRKRPIIESDSINSDSFRRNDMKVVQLAIRLLLGHMVNFLGHFPLPLLGASRLSSLVNDDDNNPYISKAEEDELSVELFNAPNVLFLIVNDSSIVSFIDFGADYSMETENKLGGKITSRIIVRDFVGKYAWDCSQLSFHLNKDHSMRKTHDIEKVDVSRASHHCSDDDDINEGERTDPLDTLLRYIGHTSPECVLNKKRCPLNSPVPASNSNFAQVEENMIALLLNQHYQEMNYTEEHFSQVKVILRNECENDSHPSLLHAETQPSFIHCRQLIDQLGFLMWEKRTKIDLLNKDERILRELRNLDNQINRETHKIAVIYVAEGQEDKNSILLNESGSKAFEEFVAGLGWEVDLATHTGFRGGLQQNQSTGITAPYFANSFMEVIFHVSTRIPTSKEEDDSLTKKLRHLGNDEVHIVWSEHTRDYRRGIIPTEFCDVLIVIYPIAAFPGYYRIHVSRKPEVPFFGPLFSGAVVHHNILPGLVRATAINASRAQRMQMCQDNGYMTYFEERSRSIETIVKHHKQQRCFEDFAATIYSPLQLGLLSSRPMSSLSTGITASIEASLASSNQSLLNVETTKSRNRPMSLSHVEQRLSPRTSSSSNSDRPLSALSVAPTFTGQ
ncbi:ral GTPase-activating protein subunit alpha-1-like isoform X2 [Dinothrombium tinctorium]|uniref:Ral GTPase-activating protein subunit alpha-1-like isoform X2 n=1 Tax=Dinothrombium tinctorium TaxID=1965070 RepID=A0A443QHV2_9ACAR|nr:ral GTPase-activating protein subunit alpha-1-like isoform X2 [Dinothrombium tinctorium]